MDPLNDVGLVVIMYMESDIIECLYSVNEALKEDYFNWNIGNQLHICPRC